MTEQLIAAAQAWADQDPDAETRAELIELIQAGNIDALQGRMGSRLEFGTPAYAANLAQDQTE